MPLGAFRVVPFGVAMLVGLALAACGGGGGGGGPGSVNPLFSADAAKPIIASYLSSTAFDVPVDVETTTVNRYSCTVLGVLPANGRQVCVVYGNTPVVSGPPKISSTVDYVLSVPTLTESGIRQIMGTLSPASFLPVLERRVDAGNVNFQSSIPPAGIVVRDSAAGTLANSCDVIQSGKVISQLVLETTGNGSFSIPAGNQFALAPGQYTINCRFTKTGLPIGIPVLEVSAYSFQVLDFQNTAPSILNVRIFNEDLLVTFAGNIRDINHSITVIADSITDSEDGFLGTALQVESFVLADGAPQPLLPVSANTYVLNIDGLGGKFLQLGFRATDSRGAVTTQTIGRSIEVNRAPVYAGGLSNLFCIPGAQQPLPNPIFTDDDDTAPLSVAYSTGNAVFACAQPGNFLYSAQATDPWGGQGSSPIFTINVDVANNHPPTITRGNFQDKQCIISGPLLSCATSITLPTCSDTDGNLADLPVIYNGTPGFPSGGTITEFFLSTGFTTLHASCADKPGLQSEELTMTVRTCVANIFTCF